MRPNAFDFRHACGLKLIPYRTGAVGAAVKRVVVGWNSRNRAEQDRVVAVHEGFDADRRFFLQPAGVITGPLAERSFIEQIVWMDKPSKAISACAGIGRPVRGPAITSTGSPINPPAASNSFLP